MVEALIKAVSEDINQANRRILIRVHGIVQGVGFRPFVFQLAREHELNGWVCNQPDGVEAEVAGAAEHIAAFIHDITLKAPPLARIVRIEVFEKPFVPIEGFRILTSRTGLSRSTLVAPDVCTCNDCLRELFDSVSRRHLYPFINCTNCGPRFTIIKDIPYDRDKTTMATFAMCPSCRKEYENPMDRRFHAQPNACWECGPQVWLETASGGRSAEREQAVHESIRLLSEGAIIAIKGLGGFHLAVDATRESAVRGLRHRKEREEKPFAVMFSGIDTLRRHCRLGRDEESLLLSPQRPIVLLKRTQALSAPEIAQSVAPGNRYLGAFLPYTPLHFLLFNGAPYGALVMTSGNRSNEPIVMNNDEARGRLEDIADYFLLHDREIYMRCDDSVMRVMEGKPRSIRRARGYVPGPVFLKKPVAPVLGVGAELKNAVCLSRHGEAFLSQHIGDLENLETLRSFELTISHLQGILEVEPECIVHDLHPDYLSTQWALRHTGNLPRLAVQHHHAHIAAVMAEQKLSGPVLGIALDGAGYGSDGTIWGGEILRVEGHRFERLGHFRHVPLPGGEKAIKEPWRMAVSYLWSLDPESAEHTVSEFFPHWSRKNVRLLIQMLDRRLNTPLTSSCGRLFDAVAALTGFPRSGAVTFEGQAAIELEQAIEPDDAHYRGAVYKESSVWLLDPFPIITEVLGDIKNKRPPGLISARFHNSLISMLSEAVEKISSETGLQRVALSGGVFQNAYLIEHLIPQLRRQKMEVFSHTEVPTNDACIALGQVHIGAHWLTRE